jgi:hypothetical protein
LIAMPTVISPIIKGMIIEHRTGKGFTMQHFTAFCCNFSGRAPCTAPSAPELCVVTVTPTVEPLFCAWIWLPCPRRNNPR